MGDVKNLSAAWRGREIQRITRAWRLPLNPQRHLAFKIFSQENIADRLRVLVWRESSLRAKEMVEKAW